MARRRRPPRPGALADLAPLRILSKILLLQTSYYTCAAVLIVFTVLVAGRELSLDLVLSWRTIRPDTTVGWMLGLVWLLNSLISVIFILIFVVRSKLVPDFALTVHFIHLVITSLYTHSIPSSWFWWALQAASASLMTVLGVWTCQYRELKPISFGFGNTASHISLGEGHRDAARGADGAGDYEMVGMNDAAEQV